MEISPRYSPKEVEPRILKDWLESDVFSAQADSKNKPYSIVIPPPNITGILHMGHGLNNTLQDVFIRFRRMQGYQSLWMPGTDHAGIATQNVVEKDLAKKGLRKEDIGREKFIEELWSWRERYGSMITGQLKKIGASCDWERSRFTLDAEYGEAVNAAFIELYQKGLIYRGNYIINWCPRCKTALSDEEAAHKELDGWLYYIKYPVQRSEVRGQKSEGRRQKAGDCIVVATTRPETMFGDTAVAINPNDKRYKWLKDSKVILPIVERELKVIEDEMVDPEFGTGVVKVTPAHDPNDFMMGKKHDLEFVNIMNDDASLNKDVPGDFIGMDRFEARQALLLLLEEKKLIEKKEPHKVSAGHCYRCNTIIEPRISLQWFVKMKPMADAAIKVVEEDTIKFYPQRWKKVYLNWMYNIRDWCISRQIWWGHRLPVYYCRNCIEKTGSKSEIRNPKSETNSKFKIPNLEHKGVIVAKEPPKKCPACGSTDIYQDEDVLDTWFSSWLWPFATFGWPFNQTSDNRLQTADLRKKKEEFDYFYPTNCLVTASEILFFWVARMIMAGLEFTDKIPFNDIIIHGTVRDEAGVKMSKSLGNTIDPLDIINKFGADALRFSLMLLAAGGSDVYLNEEKFLVGRNFANKIWNATRFILLKIKENNLKITNLELNHLDLIDNWVINELDNTIDEVSVSLSNYSINEATKKVYDFFRHIFCDWYIEIIKDNFNLDKAKVTIHVLLNSVKLLHPLMPFITEEIFSLIKDYTQLSLDKSIVKSAWPQKSGFNNKNTLTEVNSLINTICSLRNIKADLGLGQKKVKLEVCMDEKCKKLWENNIVWIKRLTFSEAIVFKPELKRVLYHCKDLSLNLDIESADLSVFIASLDKKIGNLDNFLKKGAQRLKNEKFLERASPDIVDKEKKKFEDISSNYNRLKGLRDVFK